MATGQVEVVILGISQDGGVPQPGCRCNTCASSIEEPSRRLHPVSCVIRGIDGSIHLIEATRRLDEQLAMASSVLGLGTSIIPETLCLTHAHLGHIDGLGQFGKESMGLSGVPLFASDSVVSLLRGRDSLGPFDSRIVQPGVPFSPSEGCGFEYTLVQVPHRDEHSDTHAVMVRGGAKRLLFLPDHDDWGQTLTMAGSKGIREWFSSLEVDVVLLDGTFWDSDELEGRDMADVPHPTICESLSRLGERREGDPRILFIHLNHTNPVLDPESEQLRRVVSMGWGVAEQRSVIVL